MEDFYLNIAKHSYETGKWDEETVRKNVWLYARSNGLDEKLVNDFLIHLLPAKGYSIEDKREILSRVEFDEGGLKYPNGALDDQADLIVEKFFEIEEANLGKDKIKELYDKSNEKSDVINVVTEESKKEIRPSQEESKIKPTENISKTSNEEGKVYDDIFSDVFGFGSSREETPEPSDMPETEEEFEDLRDSAFSEEEDSHVRHVEFSKERIERLKESAKKAKRYFIKGAMIVTTAFFMVGAPLATGVVLVGGYLTLSKKIKKGEFNPKGEFGKILKETVERVMNIGKEWKEERGERTK